MNDHETSFNDLLTKFRSISKNIDSFLKKDEDVGSEFISLSKSLYDFIKLKSNRVKCVTELNINSLDELHLKGFGLEEIWNQINLENEPLLNAFVSVVASLSHHKQLSLGLVHDSTHTEKWSVKTNSRGSVLENEEPSQLTTVVELAEDSENHSTEKLLPSVQNISKSGSIVDDQFFKLSEMEEFLKLEDLKDERERSGKTVDDFEVDLFVDTSDSEAGSSLETLDITQETFVPKNSKSAREVTYDDFFDDPNTEKNSSMNGNLNDDDSDDEKELDGGEDNEDIDYNDVDEEELRQYKLDEREEMDSLSSDGETVEQVLGKGSDQRSSTQKSTFEIEQEKLREKIAKLEKENLSEKPWQLRGEVCAEKRPENSLLEEHVQFEHTARPAPLITEETTKKIEDIIKQRIKDGIWDDVERKTKSIQQPFEYKRRLLMDQEKSKVSLAKVYEEEYLRKQKDEKVEEENKEHKEIKQLMRKLFAQLDALSNFSYTPKPPESEVKIINNLPAVTVEEVTPATVSDATLLAPEEVVGKFRGDLKANTERDDTDKKRDRRRKKKFQKMKYRQQIIKEKTQTGNKYNKMEAMNKLKSAKKGEVIESNKDGNKSLKSSKNFFAKLNDEVHKDSSDSQKRRKQSNTEISSKKLKL